MKSIAAQKYSASFMCSVFTKDSWTVRQLPQDDAPSLTSCETRCQKCEALYYFFVCFGLVFVYLFVLSSEKNSTTSSLFTIYQLATLHNYSTYPVICALASYVLIVLTNFPLLLTQDQVK